MTFTVGKTDQGVTVVSVDGQLIVGNRNEMKEKVIEALDAGDTKFVFDFASTGYIDSSGLGALVSVSKKVREKGGDLSLACMNEDLRMLFELTKLDTLFKIYDTSEEAVEAI